MQHGNKSKTSTRFEYLSPAFVFPIYDLFPFGWLYLVPQITLATVDKLQQTKKEANHKLRILRQKLGRQTLQRPPEVFDLSEKEVEDILVRDMVEELALLKLNVSVEDERFRRLVRGSGQGRPKRQSLNLRVGQFWQQVYPSLTLICPHPLTFNRAKTSHLSPSGCSARAARDQMLVAGQLFLSACKFREFSMEVPSERWFRYQRKGLGYEAWMYAMLRVAKYEEALQWGFDETSLDGTPTLNQWVLLQEGLGASSVVTIECCGLLVGSTAEEIAGHIRASWTTGKS
jgi:hypothetical protein